MGAHADWYEEEPINCSCERTQYEGTPGWFVTKLAERCPTHGRPEQLSDEVTARQRQISERKWS